MEKRRRNEEKLNELGLDRKQIGPIIIEAQPKANPAVTAHGPESPEAILKYLQKGKVYQRPILLYLHK
jgi:hypothetical protein